MNIGTLIRGLLGDSKPGAAKALDLKEGQIVRGVVLSVSDSGKEAVVQIQGTPVRAEVEVPLLPGETINLQVGTPGEGGLPVLKPVSLGETALVTPHNMGEALESLGLTSSKAGRDIVLAMQSAGIPLTKENAAMLNAVMSTKPAGIEASEWLDAAVISMKRGLPVTAESVKGLQQAVFGPQLHQLLSALEEQVTIWAGQAAGKDAVAAELKTSISGNNIKLDTSPSSASGAESSGSQAVGAEAGADLRSTKGNGQALSKPADGSATTGGAAPLGGGTGSAESTGNTSNVVLQHSDEQGPDVKANAKANQAVVQEERAGAGKVAVLQESEENVQPLKSGATVEPATATGKASSAVISGSPGSAVSTQVDGAAISNQAELQGGRAQSSSVPVNGGVSGNAPGVTGAASHAAAPSGAALLAKLQGVLTELRGSLPQLAVVPPADAAGQEPPPAAATPRGETPAATATPVQPDTAPPAQSEPWVGRVLKLLGAEHEQQAVRGSAMAAAETARAAAGTAAAALGSVGGEQAADTLKGVLLQIMGSSEVPPAVKETASLLVQQLTGQQLLLNTDRTAPFAQVTLFLPLQGPDGKETASVHIQSRRGPKGELDAANCRLWFDLDMKQLGQTLVDVQVAHRIVSLKLHNDQPWVLELLEQRSEDIKSAIESIGYQLSGLRTEPLPELSLSTELTDSNHSKFADYVPDAYKGVDYRI